jgi:hypothetical protein
MTNIFIDIPIFLEHRSQVVKWLLLDHRKVFLNLAVLVNVRNEISSSITKDAIVAKVVDIGSIHSIS